MSNMELQMLLLRSGATGGGILGGVDWLTLLALLSVAILYFLAPVFGYRTSHRGLMLASLWVFIGKMALGLLRVGIFAMEILDRPKMGGSASSQTTLEMVLVLMSVFETGMFVLGIVLFVIGLTSLRREMELPRSLPRDFRD
ncbi:MAG: hypothetical protein ACRELG_16105 [Gemmataceae bacterium]